MDDYEDPYGEQNVARPELSDEIASKYTTKEYDVTVPQSASQSNNNAPSDLPDDKLIMKDGLNLLKQILK